MEAQDHVAEVSALFDLVSGDYDNTGVTFFGPIAQLLTDQVDPQPGERALDIGCGSGAVTTRLAAAVGESGSVIALDVSPGMVARTTALTAELAQVRVVEGDAMKPEVGDDFDLITASLVIFFLPEPWDAIRRWVSLLRPGGRIALTTFGGSAPAWQTAETLLRTYMPGFDPRVYGPTSPFGSDEGMESFLRDAGAARVRTAPLRVPVVFEDAGDWLRFSRSVGQRAAWKRMPADEVDTVIAAAGESLLTAQGEDGRLHVWQDVRSTIGWRP